MCSTKQCWTQSWSSYIKWAILRRPQSPLKPTTLWWQVRTHNPSHPRWKHHYPKRMKVLRIENHQNGHWLWQAHLNEKAQNGLHFHPPGHLGDCPTGQIPVAVVEVEEVVDDDHQIMMIWTKVQIQMTSLEQKTMIPQMEKGKPPCQPP